MPGLAPPRRQRLAGLGGRGGSIKPIPRPGKHDSICGCDNPTFEIVDSSKICMNCGTEISQSNIVAEVTFGESASGAATVDGAHVGEDQRHANTIGPAARRIGASTRTREDAEQNGREAIRIFTGRIPIAQIVVDQAVHIWRLASNEHHFVQGRRAEEVAAACLYAACRRDKNNTVLLMDLAEIISVNVFALGDTFKALAKKLYLDVHAQSHLVEVEPLILKYASKLEFGAATRQVAEDAVKIIRRMKRDWIVTGRHPAGLCGACIILAARMNNFRRSVREVVFVVKVADLTIAKRLEEFKRTRSSFLTVDEFRKVGNRIKMQHDPPAILEAKERARKLLERKRKRQEYEASKENTIEIGSNVTSRQSSLAPSPTPEPAGESSQPPQAEEEETVTSPPSPKRRKRTTATAPARREPRRDADGFVIPELPIDPLLLAAANAAAEEIANEGTPDPTATSAKDKKKAVKPRKEKKDKEVTPAPSPLTQEELIAEEELEGEIEDILRNDDCISKSKNDIEREKLEDRAKVLADQQRAMTTAALAQRAETQGRRHYIVPDTEIIGEDEFADDPEVQNALLTEEQVRVKEKIWVAHNEDWLRAQQTKQLKRALDEAEGKNKDKMKRKKRSRMGDGTVLEGGTPVESPADANRRMLEKRAPKQFSQRINYAALGAIYNRGTPSEAGTPAPESRAGSAAPSETAADGPEDANEDEADGDEAALPTPPPTQVQTVSQDAGKVSDNNADGEEEEDEADADDYWPDADKAGLPDEDEDEDEEAADYNQAIAGANPYGSDAGGYESDAGGYEEEYVSDHGGDDEGFEDD